MTCNQNWTEITEELREGNQCKVDQIWLLVFKQKKDQLIKDIRSGKVLGKVQAKLWVIELKVHLQNSLEWQR